MLSHLLHSEVGLAFQADHVQLLVSRKHRARGTESNHTAQGKKRIGGSEEAHEAAHDADLGAILVSALPLYTEQSYCDMTVPYTCTLRGAPGCG